MAIYKTDEGSITNLTSSTSVVNSDLSVGSAPYSLYADTVEATIGRSLRFPSFTEIDNNMSPYTLTDNDTALLVDVSGGPVDIDITSAAAGRFLMVKDTQGASSTKNITFTGATIDGGSYSINTDYEGIILYLGKSSNWYIMGKS